LNNEPYLNLLLFHGVKDDGDLTVLGEIVSALPVDVRLGKLVIFGFLFGVLEETIIIAAGNDSSVKA
jgi:HrpA-like RNA helicase